jgi:hypothetical protein
MPTRRLAAPPVLIAIAAACVACSSSSAPGASGAGGAGATTSATTSATTASGGSSAGGSSSSSTSSSATGGAGGAGDPWSGPLPEGANGLAAKHPGDVGIGSDPAVIFADDFESYASVQDLWGRYTNVYQQGQLAIATDPPNVYQGKQAVQMTVPTTETELANALERAVSPEREILFLRYYSKFEPPYDITGSSHNGSFISSHYFVNGQATPGVPADGTNKFLAGYEDWRGDESVPSPGPLNVYLYHPEQRSQWGDHLFPTGDVSPYSPTPFDFGPTFVKRPDVIPELGRWACYELMVKPNTPGKRDGRIAFWYEGKLAGDFPNLRLRDVPSLTIDRFGFGFHAHANPGAPTRKWYDAVVAATSYIGPASPP